MREREKARKVFHRNLDVVRNTVADVMKWSPPTLLQSLLRLLLRRFNLVSYVCGCSVEDDKVYVTTPAVNDTTSHVPIVLVLTGKYFVLKILLYQPNSGDLFASLRTFPQISGIIPLLCC